MYDVLALANMLKEECCFSTLCDMFLLLLQCNTALVQLYSAETAVLMQSVSSGFDGWP